jgi:hypothetical protein
MWQVALKCFQRVQEKLIKDFYSLPMPLDIQDIKSTGISMEIYKLVLGKSDLDKSLEIASHFSKVEDPDQWFWLKEVGRCLSLQGKDIGGVKEYYLQSLEIQESLSTRLELLQLLISQKNQDHACINAEIKILLSKYPNCAQAWDLNAQISGTEDSYLKVLSLDPYHGPSRYHLNSEKLKAGKEVSLIYLFKIMETCHSISPKVYQEWADLAKETGQWDFYWIGYWLANQNSICSSS